jgi:hypothetical protein
VTEQKIKPIKLNQPVEGKKGFKIKHKAVEGSTEISSKLSYYENVY